MKTLVKLSTLSVLLAVFGASAGQGEGVVNFKGTVVDAPCSIESVSADQSIDFGQISKTTLAAGGTSPQKSLAIRLVNCNVANLSKGVQVTFTGNTMSAPGKDGAVVPVLTELATSGSTNTAIVINNGTDLSFGTAPTPIALGDGENTLQFSTWVKQATGKVVAAGDFTAVANFNLSYQ